VLTLDGHDTHETRRIKRAAFDHNVILIILPSKTTHKLQPLDVGVFASVQHRWSRHCDDRLAQGVRIDRYNLIPEYLAVHRTITPSLVQKAFVKTGIYPLNPNIFNDHDFAPSQASSSIPTFPPSYPHEVPLSVPLEPSEIPGDSEDQDHDGLGVSNDLDDHFLPDLSPSTESITLSASILPHQPTLPLLPPYEHVIRQTPKELWDFMRLHQIQCEAVLKEAIAQHDAANAHCTIARHRINAITKQLTNKTQNKRQKSKKSEARVLTLPELREEFDIKDAEEEAKEKADLEKAAQKKANEMARTLRINEEIRSRVFDCPLASYKRKDDLVALAGALLLPMDGTVVELMKVIKGYLDKNPTRADEPRFKGLFGSSRKRSSAKSAGPSSLIVDPAVLAPTLAQPSLMEDTLIPDSLNYDLETSSPTPFSGGSMSYIHAPYMSHNTPYTPLTSHNAPYMPLMSNNSPFAPNLPYHT